MTLSESASIPVSGANLGLVAGVDALEAEIEGLGDDIAGIGVAAAAQVQFATSLPPNPAILVQFAAAFTLANLTNQLNPLNWIAVSGTARADLLVQQGLVEGQIAIVAPVVAALEAGLSTGGLYAWSYSGTARGFGTTLQTATRYGVGSGGPRQTVNAVIVSASEHSTWTSFGAGVYVGRSADVDLATISRVADTLTSLGELNGYEVNTGVRGIYVRLALLLESLQALAAAIEVQLDFTLGLNLPEPQAVLDAGASVSIDLDDFTVSVDFDAQISFINAKIALIAALVAELQAQLTTTGLTVWTYEGMAQGLGSEFAAEVLNGIGSGSPGDPTYGLVVAAASPIAWAAFGNIFYTG